MILLDINSNGKRIEVKVGDEIQIELKGTGSTGYIWSFDKLDQNFFDLIAEERNAGPFEKGELVGTPVLMVWRLKARQSGASSIRMLYYRPWEGKEKAANQFEVFLVVTR